MEYPMSELNHAIIFVSEMARWPAVLAERQIGDGVMK
jgi:hypothetical protein